jgi:hypothetical protein
MRTIYAVALALFCNLANANIILEVDLSDPSAAIFNSTAAFADATLDNNVFNGITLIGFFGGNTTEVDFLPTDSGSINVFNAPDASSRFALVEWFVGVFVGGWTLNDLNFFDDNAPDLVHFFDDEIALTGTATLDLSALVALPALGTSCNVIIGEPDSGLVVGQWVIVADASEVPTPNPLLLIVIGLLMLGHSRRNKT